jgi:hypothetical protein
MSKRNLYYPAALIIIILFAGYLLYTGAFDKPKVDLAAYQKLCDRYLQAPSGTYTHDQMQLLVYKIDYLFPDSVDKLSVPAERKLKICAQALTERLKQK